MAKGSKSSTTKSESSRRSSSMAKRTSSPSRGNRPKGDSHRNSEDNRGHGKRNNQDSYDYPPTFNEKDGLSYENDNYNYHDDDNYKTEDSYEGYFQQGDSSNNTGGKGGSYGNDSQYKEFDTAQDYQNDNDYLVDDGQQDSYGKNESFDDLHFNDGHLDNDSYPDSGEDSFYTGSSKEGGAYDANEPLNDPPYDEYDVVTSKRPMADSPNQPSKGSGNTNQEADMVFTENEVYGDSSNNSDPDMEFTEDEVYGYQESGIRSSRNEWNKRSRPREGQTLMGHQITMTRRNGRLLPSVTIDDRVYFITVYGGRRGIFYGGRADQTRNIIRSISQGTHREDPVFMTKAILSYTVLGEGGFSSINTYDNKIFTLGTGLAGPRLNRYLQGLRGTELGNAINEISYFRGLRFNGSQRIRLDIQAIHQIVVLFENPDYISLVGQKSVADYLNNSLKISHPRNRENIRQWVAENDVRPEIIGTAAYLCHGRPRYTPVPLNDVFRAVRVGRGNLSAQLAALLKLHAQRINLDRNPERVGGGPSGRQASAAVTRRLPNKVPHFVHAMRASGNTGFRFNYEAARSVLPCISSNSWRTNSSRPSGLYLEHEGRFYALGSRIG